MSLRLKILFRYLERLALTLTLLLILWLMGQALLGPLYLAYRFTPPPGTATPQALEAAIGASLQRFTLHKDNRAYTLAVGPMLLWAMPEGPPVYIFDPRGGLIDATPDLGEDPAFVERWITGSDFEALGRSIRKAIAD